MQTPHPRASGHSRDKQASGSRSQPPGADWPGWEQAGEFLARPGAGGRRWVANGAGAEVPPGTAPIASPAWGARRPWSSHPSQQAGLGVRRLRGIGAVGPEPLPHPACPAGAQCRPCGFSGASRSGLGSPHSLSHPLQLWPAAVGPSLRRGVNGALAGRGPAQPTEARRGAASMWAGRASLSLVGWQLGPPDRAVDGPGARGLVRKPPKDSVQPQPTPCTWTGRHTRELMAPGQRQAWAREGPWGRPARHRLRLSDCLWCAAGEEARGSCRGMRRPWDDPVCWDGQSQAEP